MFAFVWCFFFTISPNLENSPYVRIYIYTHVYLCLVCLLVSAGRPFTEGRLIAVRLPETNTPPGALGLL